MQHLGAHVAREDELAGGVLDDERVDRRRDVAARDDGVLGIEIEAQGLVDDDHVTAWDDRLDLNLRGLGRRQEFRAGLVGNVRQGGGAVDDDIDARRIGRCVEGAYQRRRFAIEEGRCGDLTRVEHTVGVGVQAAVEGRTAARAVGVAEWQVARGDERVEAVGAGGTGRPVVTFTAGQKGSENNDRGRRDISVHRFLHAF